FQALGQTFFLATLVAFGTTDFHTFIATFLEAAFLAFLIALGQSALQRGRIGGQGFLTIAGRHAAMARREAVDAPTAGIVFDHSYRHALTCHSTVCSRNS